MGRPRIYDWEAILAGRCQLEQGVDYDVQTRDMQSAIYAEARRRGLKVTTKTSKAPDLSNPWAPGPREPRPDIITVQRVRNDLHDWDKILDGSPRPIFGAELRTTTPESFIRQARRAAAARGLRVRVKRQNNGVWIQALELDA